MAQLKTLDTAFPGQHASLALGAVAIVDGAAPDDKLLKELLAERLQSIPRCTQLLRDAGLRVDRLSGTGLQPSCAPGGGSASGR